MSTVADEILAHLSASRVRRDSAQRQGAGHATLVVDRGG
jgi:hypothetical protein